MKFLVKWVEYWDAQIEAATEDEAIEIAMRELCNAPHATLYDWDGFEIEDVVEDEAAQV